MCVYRHRAVWPTRRGTRVPYPGYRDPAGGYPGTRVLENVTQPARNSGSRYPGTFRTITRRRAGYPR
eukprot:2810864-Rhodomonas_salina.2